MENIKDYGYICFKTLKERWGTKLIEKFYPIADKEVENPHYKYAAPMKLYDFKKVKRIEQYKRFIKMKEEIDKKRSSAKKAAKKAVKTKYDKSIKYAMEVEINIPTFSKNELEEKAYRHWYDWKSYRTDFDETLTCSEQDIERWCVNYLRHECTTYDDDLGNLYGNVGVQEAHDILKDRINNAIYEKYDWLR